MRIQALASLIHDGAAHPPGDTLTVPDGAAAVLIRRGIAREVRAPVASDPVAREPVATTPVATRDETTTRRRTTRVRRSPQTREAT